MMICKYRDEKSGACSLHSDFSRESPLIEYCVDGPCPDEDSSCTACPLDGHCEFVKCGEKEDARHE